jgi:hypothetical protein
MFMITEKAHRITESQNDHSQCPVLWATAPASIVPINLASWSTENCSPMATKRWCAQNHLVKRDCCIAVNLTATQTIYNSTGYHDCKGIEKCTNCCQQTPNEYTTVNCQSAPNRTVWVNEESTDYWEYGVDNGFCGGQYPEPRIINRQGQWKVTGG